ncbi:hypothetical protein [Burkholderia alba]|uniref:hypothetical protein n=1 Tax=Burkholderia alba TaxID=2683677 RepID=UPI002B05527F|nr:hypothetical protein [Burkholderia alba]
MKQSATLAAAAVVLLSSLGAAPAFADADHDYPPSRAAAPRTVAQESTAAPDYAQSSYGANTAGATQAGKRATPAGLRADHDPFTINGRSMYSQP